MNRNVASIFQTKHALNFVNIGTQSPAKLKKGVFSRIIKPLYY
jgi:hypothetical protein